MYKTKSISTSTDIADFYDIFQKRQLRDYVYGNLRVQMSIDFCLNQMSAQTKNILDVGCGVGISSYHFSQHSNDLSVTGIDISPKNIQAANRLFGHQRNLNFLESDMSRVPPGGPFDLITLLDVYEHIPVEAREEFHSSLSSCLSDSGVLILTTPSPLHQEWLADEEPEGLQIVDETITLENVADLAVGVSGQLVSYDWVDVWKTNQYCYSIISRNPEYRSVHHSWTPLSVPQRFSRKIKRIFYGRQPDPIEQRREHVKQKLDVVID